MLPSGNSTGLKLYATRPYESDGGFSLNGLALTTGVGVAVAVVMGIVAGFVGQFFYAILIFPVAIGLAVGAAQTWAIEHSKIRSPLACGAAGLVAGIVAVTTMHFWNYQAFQKDMQQAALEEASMRQEVEQTRDPREREYLKAALAEYEADSEVVAAKKVNSFVSFLDWSARLGVEITPGRSTSGGLNLGYTGTYIYWGGEALIVALISAAVARRRASAPFCVKCDTWTVERELGTLTGSLKAIGETVQSGNLADLTSATGTSAEEVSISLCECPSCCSQEDVVVQVNQIRYNNGQRSKSPTARAIYPRTAAEELERYFGQATSQDDRAAELVGAAG